MQEHLLLLGKIIDVEKSEIVLEYHGEENWQDYFKVMGGDWKYDKGYLVGKELENKGGILFSKNSFDFDVMMTFKVATVLPCTRDLNAVWCAKWDEKNDYLGDSYVCGLNGWYEHKSGIERCGEYGFYTSTTLYNYTPGSIVEMTCGSINGHCFMFVDDKLVTELHDNHPIVGGYIGFSPFCTELKITDVVVRKIKWTSRYQQYEIEQ